MEESIKDALSKDAHVGRLPISVVVLSNVIVLRGQVRTYFEKQIATERAMGVLRSKNYPFELRNEIVVGSTLQPAQSAVVSLQEERRNDKEADLPTPPEGQD
jgi:osmotically-inducible protein OsmY